MQKLALVTLTAHHGLLPRLKTAAFRFLHYYELTYTRKSTHYCFLAEIDCRVVSFYLCLLIEYRLIICLLFCSFYSELYLLAARQHINLLIKLSILLLEIKKGGVLASNDIGSQTPDSGSRD